MIEDKNVIREKANNIIRELSSKYKKDSSSVIVKKLINSDMYKDADVIFAFVGMENEIDTKPFIKIALSEGKKIGVPLCTGKGIMEVREITSLKDLKVGSYGILEPKKTCKLVNKGSIDYAIIPCVACDLNGKRLGHGGGYYDRYLVGKNFHCTVICFDKLIMENIPVDSYDLIMDSVVTENN